MRFRVLQDNVFVQLVCSIQYRVVKENADDAFYELQNPREQIQAYVFDGQHGIYLVLHFYCLNFQIFKFCRKDSHLTFNFLTSCQSPCA